MLAKGKTNGVGARRRYAYQKYQTYDIVNTRMWTPLAVKPYFSIFGCIQRTRPKGSGSGGTLLFGFDGR